VTASRSPRRALANVVSDEVLDTFAVIGMPEDPLAPVRDCYGDVATRVSLTVPDEAQVTRGPSLLEQLRA
jgi:hypothetical protein